MCAARYGSWYACWHESLYDAWRTMRGVARSLRMYYGESVRSGDLVFDIGAHVGDRTACFRRLGARVVAVEPQPPLVRTLKVLYGRDRAVSIEPVAVGRNAGTLAFSLNPDNPTVSTASEAFRAAAAGAPGWEGQRWTKRIEVPVTTLDKLVSRHGA